MTDIYYNEERIVSGAHIARSFVSQAIGMMFRTRVCYDRPLIFVLSKSGRAMIHMVFVFVPLDIVFLDNDKKIIEVCCLRPWIGYKSVGSAKYVIEMREGSIKKFGLRAGDMMFFKE